MNFLTADTCGFGAGAGSHRSNRRAAAYGLFVVAALVCSTSTVRADTFAPGRYLVRAQASDRCLDIGSDPSQVVQRECAGAILSQQFDVAATTSGYYRLTNVASGKVLDVRGALDAAGTEIIYYAWSGGYHQQFLFQRNGDGFLLRGRDSSRCIDIDEFDADEAGLVQQMDCTGAANQTFSFEPVTTRAEPVTSGRYTFHAAHSDLCLDLPGSSTANFTQLQQWACTGAPNQQFDVEYVGNDQYELHVVSSGKCVDLDAAITSNGNEIQQYTCDNYNRQRWYFSPAGDGSFFVQSAVDRTKVWDVEGAVSTSGAQLQIYSSHGGANQRFWLEPAARTTNIADGVYTLTNVRSSKCVDVPSSNTTPGVQLQQYTCNGTNAQNFRVTQVSNGLYSVVNVNSNLALEVADFSLENSEPVQHHDPHGGSNQLFSFVPASSGGYTLRPAHSYGCVDVAGASTSNNAKIQQYTCNGTDAQIFRLTGNANVPLASGAAQNAYPVVLVHGFLGFGRDELFGLKYWGGGFGSGGTRDIQEMLRARGVQTFTASVGPLSSARDRALELFYQIKGGCVDYGPYHSTHLERLDGTPDDRTLVRVLDGGLNPDGTRRPRKCWATDPANNPQGDPIALYPEWGDDSTKKIHLIGHSFGSATIRMLLELLRNGDPNELAADPSLLDESGQANPYTGGKNWVSSLTSVAGTQDGASLAVALDPLFPLITNVIGGVAVISGLLGIDEAVYDLDLQQFGIERSPGESIWDYIERVRTSPVFGVNPTRNSAAYDLTPEGMNELNATIDLPNDVYYFSYSGQTSWKGFITGHHYPVLKTNPIFAIFTTILGYFTRNEPGKVVVDSSWWPSDGILNVRGQIAPTNSARVEYRTGAPSAGVWNHFGTYQGWDHLDWCGTIFVDKSVDAVNAIYVNQTNLLRTLAN